MLRVDGDLTANAGIDPNTKMVCYFHGEVDSAKAVQLKGNDCIIFNSVTTDALLISVSLTLAASPYLASFDAHSLRLHSLVCNNGAASRAEVIISALDRMGYVEHRGELLAFMESAFRRLARS